MNFHYVIICTHLQAVYIIRKSSHYHKVLTVHYSAVESLSTETCKNHTVQGGVDQEFIMKQEKETAILTCLHYSTCVPVYGSNPGTGEHGGSQEGRGRHVEGHSVSFLHPLPLEHISNLTGHLQQLSGVGTWK